MSESYTIEVVLDGQDQASDEVAQLVDALRELEQEAGNIILPEFELPVGGGEGGDEPVRGLTGSMGAAHDPRESPEEGNGLNAAVAGLERLLGISEELEAVAGVVFDPLLADIASAQGQWDGLAESVTALTGMEHVIPVALDVVLQGPGAEIFRQWLAEANRDAGGTSPGTSPQGIGGARP